MLNQLKNLPSRLKKAWKLSGNDYFAVPKKAITDEEFQALAESGKITTTTQDSGKGGFLGGYMTEHEVAMDIKENELGWRKVFDKVRNLGKDNEDGI